MAGVVMLFAGRRPSPPQCGQNQTRLDEQIEEHVGCDACGDATVRHDVDDGQGPPKNAGGEGCAPRGPRGPSEQTPYAVADPEREGRRHHLERHADPRC